MVVKEEERKEGRRERGREGGSHGLSCFKLPSTGSDSIANPASIMLNFMTERNSRNWE